MGQVFISPTVQWSPSIWGPGTSIVEDNFSMDWQVGGWFLDDSNALHL